VQEARVTQRHAKMTKAEREEYKVLRMKAQEGERAVGPWAGLLLCTGLREPAATHPCVISTRFVCVCLCVCVCVCVLVCVALCVCPCGCVHACTCICVCVVAPW
jgi:hypothetical protein